MARHKTEFQNGLQVAQSLISQALRKKNGLAMLNKLHLTAEMKWWHNETTFTVKTEINLIEYLTYTVTAFFSLSTLTPPYKQTHSGATTIHSHFI